MKKRAFSKKACLIFCLLFVFPFLGIARICPLFKKLPPQTIYAQTPTYNLYFGDLHAHSTISNDAHPLGGATYNNFYPYGRDTIGLNFCVMSDHAEDITSSEWETVKNLAAQYNAPGSFTTLVGFEWTSNTTGHKSVYFPGANVPPAPWSSKDANYDTPGKLWGAAGTYGAFTNPHHPQGGPAATNWSWANETHQRLVEIYSKWGNSEYDGAQPVITNPVSGSHSVQEALAMGQKLGFVGGTDTHSSLCGYLEPKEGGKLWRNPNILKYRGGLTGVWATANTREALWEAFQNRRTFATTGEKISLWYTVNGQPLGSTLTTLEAPTIAIEVKATKPIKKIRILRDNQEIYVEEGFTGKMEASFTYTDTNLTEGNHYYYVRMGEDDANGDGYPEQAWASPVWATKASGPAPTSTPTPIPTLTATPTPVFSLLARWNRITWPKISGWTARMALDDIDLDCGRGTSWAIVRKVGMSWEKYYKSYGGGNFPLETGQTYQVNVTRNCSWRP